MAEIFSAGVASLEKIDAVAVSVMWKGSTVTAGCLKYDRRQFGTARAGD